MAQDPARAQREKSTGQWAIEQVLQLVRACQRENNRPIQEVLQPELIDDSTDKEEAERRVEAAEARVMERQQGKVFHDHKARKIPLHVHTSNMA